jgi:kynurenine formamidase
MARSGIAGRGVLLDWRRYAIANSIEYSPFERYPITLAELQLVAKQQQVEFQPGDILLIRTGWTEEYNKLDVQTKLQLPGREVRASCGVQASREMIEWHWDNAFSAVASDTVAYEVWPSPREIGVAIHEVFLSGWGLPIGESWDLESLSETCAVLQKWTFFLTSQPLNIRGGVASPSNALAIL